MSRIESCKQHGCASSPGFAIWRLAFVVLIFLSVALSFKQAFAQESADTAPLAEPKAAPAPAPTAASGGNPGAQKNKKTTIDFEDQLIEGSRQKPELFYLLQQKEFNYKRLIRLRENFLPEMRKDSEGIQGRAGSGQ